MNQLNKQIQELGYLIKKIEIDRTPVKFLCDPDPRIRSYARRITPIKQELDKIQQKNNKLFDFFLPGFYIISMVSLAILAVLNIITSTFLMKISLISSVSLILYIIYDGFRFSRGIKKSTELRKKLSEEKL